MFNLVLFSTTQGGPGHFGIGKVNKTEQTVLELCDCHKLCITNTFFYAKLHHRISLRQQRSEVTCIHWACA